jgi:hypothetical protein
MMLVGGSHHHVFLTKDVNLAKLGISARGIAQGHYRPGLQMVAKDGLIVVDNVGDTGTLRVVPKGGNYFVLVHIFSSFFL